MCSSDLEAMAFMSATTGENPLQYMVFAEQRLLSMCAKERQMPIHLLSTMEALFGPGQTTFTHIWGYKRQLRMNGEERTKFCKRCMKRIREDYPEFYPILLKIPELKYYA